jgi:hypothetical protein
MAASRCPQCGQRLPAPVAANKIKSPFKNGVLTITRPETEVAKQKAIRSMSNENPRPPAIVPSSALLT